MKTRINVYGLTFVAIIVFFVFGQKWKYDHEKEILSQLNQTEKFDEMRFAAQEAYAEEIIFQTTMGKIDVEGNRDSAVQALRDIQDEIKQKHKTEIEDDNRRIDEFKRDHGF